MARRLSRLLAKLSRERRLIVIVWGAAAILGLVRLLFKIPIPIFDLQIPEYGIVVGVVLVAAGLITASPRGLVAAVAGTLLAAVSALALLTVASGRTDLPIYGLPLVLIAGSGLAVFSHSVLYARPTVARAGMAMVLAGFLVAILLIALAWARVALRGDDGIGLIAVITGAAVAITVVTIVTAGPAGRRRRDGP